jgi:hypothetical protein
MTDGSPLAELARREVFVLHELFGAWFRAGTTAVDFSLCEAALAPDFCMVAPDGMVNDRAAVLQRLRQARNSQPADFAIVISAVEPLWQQGDAILLGYVEEQYRSGSTTRRRSTALFTAEPSAPRGVVWRHLQETWMPVAG